MHARRATWSQLSSVGKQTRQSFLFFPGHNCPRWWNGQPTWWSAKNYVVLPYSDFQIQISLHTHLCWISDADALKRQGQCTGEASRTDLRIVVTEETIPIRDTESSLVGRFHHRSSFVIRRANTPWCVGIDQEVFSYFLCPNLSQMMKPPSYPLWNSKHGV